MDKFDSACLEGFLIYSCGLEDLKNIRNGVNLQTPWGRAQLTQGNDIWDQLYPGQSPTDVLFPGNQIPSNAPAPDVAPPADVPVTDVPDIEIP